MRYGDGGGVDQAGRARREQVRQRAAAMFDAGMHPVEVAAVLEVSTKSGYQWHRAWESAGALALASKGPPGRARTLSQAQVQRLEAALSQGAIAAGYDDARWTLARVAALIRTLFHRTISVQTVSVLCGAWAGVRSCPSIGRWSVTKQPSPIGSATPGPR